MTGKRLRVNVMSAVASRGALWFTVCTERFTAPVFTAFLDRLAHQTRRFLRRRQRQPHIVRGQFHAPHVRHAIM
ncbi:hypothetical protein ACOBQX_03420 [Actinokineospora sp. G85]|uniref:hypothetical protein n=1 Tax=Actinokineospora sp. G85 TaxID=3406626 RepID=UPI003C760E28